MVTLIKPENTSGRCQKRTNKYYKLVRSFISLQTTSFGDECLGTVEGSPRAGRERESRQCRQSDADDLLQL
jgi:hypothetical protein